MRKFLHCIIVLMLFSSSCGWLSDNRPLGNNLSLWEGDKKEDRIIVYCEGNCNAGIFVIPTYARHYDSNGHYAEYVESVKSNDRWLIVETFRITEKQKNYWIVSKQFDITNIDCSKIKCDSILQEQVMGPFSIDEFRNRVHTLNVDMDF